MSTNSGEVQSEKLRTKWYETQKENLLHGKTGQALAELQAQCPPSGGKGVSDPILEFPRKSRLLLREGLRVFDG